LAVGRRGEVRFITEQVIRKQHLQNRIISKQSGLLRSGHALWNIEHLQQAAPQRSYLLILILFLDSNHSPKALLLFNILLSGKPIEAQPPGWDTIMDSAVQPLR
jgi:hypothetical protein